MVDPPIGRDPEWERLRRALREAAEGQPRFVVIGGEAGVGKTRLVEHFAAEAADFGALVLSGACLALGTEGLPLTPIISALRGVVGRLGTRALLPADLAVLLPELSKPGDPALDQARLFYLVGVLLHRLSAERPVLLVVEDLHWADRSTLRVLDGLARGQRGTRMLVVVTHRTDSHQAGHPLRPFLAELERLRGVLWMELARFTRGQTAELIREVTGAPPPAVLVDRVFGRSGGNAFFAEVLVDAERSGATQPGVPLTGLLLSRVDQLPEPAKHVVRAVAVGGPKVSHPLLAAAAGLPEDDLLHGLRAAADGHVLLADGDGYTFRHALAWEAVLNAMLPGEGIRLHRAYAQVLENRPELLPADRVAAEVAYHWSRAAEPAKALPALLRAASVAKSVYAHAEHYRMLVRALELAPLAPGVPIDRAAVMAEASRAAWRSGAPSEALDLVERALAQVSSADDPERVALLLAQRGRFLLRSGRSGAQEAIETAERLVATRPGPVRTRVLVVLAVALGVDGHAARAREVSAEAARSAQRLGHRQLQVAALTTLAATLGMSGEHDEALTRLEQARALTDGGRDPGGLTKIQLNLITELWALGRYDEAAAAAKTGAPVAEEAGLARTLGVYIAVYGAWALFAAGRWKEAAARLAEALDSAPQGPFAVLPNLASGELALARGDLEVAHGFLAAARAAHGGDGDIAEDQLPMARLSAEIALAEGRIDDARHAIAEVLDVPPGRSGVVPGWLLLTTGARLVGRLRTGGDARTDPDRDLVARLRMSASGLPTTTPPLRALALQFDAELAGPSNASARWLEVVSAWDEVGDPLHSAYARLRAAEAELGRLHRRAAGALLREAAQQAAQVGAGRLLAEIQALARGARIGLASPRRPSVEVHPAERLSLTPREIEVLRLVAEGRSNRQIAGALVISVRTVSVHVSRILTKLNVASRGEAAAAAYRLRLFDVGRG